MGISVHRYTDRLGKMKDEDKSKQALIEELVDLRAQLNRLKTGTGGSHTEIDTPEAEKDADSLLKTGQFISEQNYEIIDYLKNSRLFSHLPEHVIRQLVPLSEITEYPEGTTILREGQQNDRVYIIVRGEVEIFASDHSIIRLRRRGDIFGEMSIISDKPVSASVVVKVPVKAFSIRGREVGKYTDMDADTLHNMLYRIFAMIMTDKLSMTTDKAKQFEISEQRLLKEIRERKKTEKILRESEQRLNKAQAVAKIGSWEYDIEKNLYWGSAQTFEIFGLEHESPYVPKEVVDSLRSDNKRLWQSMSDLIQYNRKYDVEFELNRTDGVKKHVRSIGELVWEDDIRKKVIGVIQDITEQKKTQEEQRRLENQLFQAQKLDAIGLLASGIAHDFNNLLNVFYNYSDLSIKYLAELPDTDRVIQYQSNIRKAAERAENLINQILTFSRSGGYEPRNISLAPIIKESLIFLRSSIPTIIVINHSLAPDLKNIYGDPIQIQQVLMNLCTNASHAMEEKGGKLNIVVHNILIQCRSASTGNLDPGEYVCLQISDTGEGIDPETLARIFEPFYTTKKAGKGTGLGLSVVHGIVKRHGGVVLAESQKGIGTTISVYLPTSTEASDSIPDDSGAELPRGSESILVVDDEELVLSAYTEMLELQGYRVTEASSGLEALEIFEKQAAHIDLVITDYSMPRMTGIELGQKIQQMKKNTPVILISGLGQQVPTEKTESAGIKTRLKKPIGFETFVRQVRLVLDG